MALARRRSATRVIITAVLLPTISRLTLSLVVPVAFLAGCGGSDAPSDRGAVRDDGPEHVHGLGTNPKDGALMVATHSGLFRLASGERRLERVGDLRQDTMGFTVVGPDRFLGSGHPDARTGDPDHLGLIASDDGGRSWTARSLSGKADLHVLAGNPNVLYAVDALSGRLLASGDQGRGWTRREAPGTVFSLVVDPGDETALVASTDDGLFTSADAGATWRRRPGVQPSLLAWPRGGEILAVAGDGTVAASPDRGRTWRRRGALQAEPTAFTAQAKTLHVADAEGRIFRSEDGGRTWAVRAQP